MTDKRKDEIEAAIKWARFYDPRKSFEVRHLAVLIKVAEADLSPPVPDDVAEAIKRIEDEIKIGVVCGQEGWDFDCDDIELIIRAASTPSAEVRALRDALQKILNMSYQESIDNICEEALNQTSKSVINKVGE